MRSHVPAAAVATLLALAVGLPARAGERDRQDLLRAFNQLKKDFDKAKPAAGKPRLGGVKGKQDDDEKYIEVPRVPAAMQGWLRSPYSPKPYPVEGGGRPMPAKLVVKVWGVLLENGKPGKLVDMTKYVWRPKEQFLLYFESPVPVRVGLHNLDLKTKKLEQFLPDEKYPASFGAVIPGQAFRFPVALEMLPHDEDEGFVITVTSAGGPPPDPPPGPTPGPTPPPPLPDDGGGRVSIKAARKFAADLDAYTVKAFSHKGSRLDLQPSGGDGRAADGATPDDVAVIAYGADGHGVIVLTMKKGR